MNERAPRSELTDRYELGEALGVGGTATVYRAVHRASGRRVAVKIFDAAPRAHRSEVETLADLHHPGLVEIDEVGVHDGSTYLVMRLVDGESLAQRIAGDPLPAADVVAIGARLADTLRHVHGCGVVHRDVKPSNVLLDACRSPHLTDFGVAKLVDATRITATGSVVGTPAYMAPEQVRGQEVGSAADVYALGLVLLEALTGRREFPGSVVESAVARLHRDPVVPAELPATLRTLLAAMTAQEPADRPPAAAVARCVDSLVGPTAIPAPATTRRRPARIAVAASALAVAVVVGIMGFLPAGQAPIAAAPQVVPASPEPTAAEPVSVAPVARPTATPGPPTITEIPDVVPDAAVPAARPVLVADDSPAGVGEPADGPAGDAAEAKGHEKAKKGKKNNDEKE